MAANVIGLIEIDTGLAAHLAHSADDAVLDRSLPSLARLDDEPVITRVMLSHPCRNSRHCTQFVRADFDQLQLELQIAFADLLQRLFEGD